jgi:hypothetical protein
MGLNSLRAMADALLHTDRRFPWIGPSPEEKEVALVLIEMSEIHVPDRVDPDNPTDDPMFWTYGFCSGCYESWPCRAVLEQEREGVAWLGRAAARVHAHARGPIDPVIRAVGEHRDDVRRDAQGRVLSPPRSPCNVEIHPDRELEGTTT